MSKSAGKKGDPEDAVERACRVIARARGVSVSAVRHAVDTIGHADEAALAIKLLSEALGRGRVRVERATSGKPLIVDIVADAPVAWGEGVSSGDLLVEPDFAPIVLDEGQRARAAVFKTATRNAGLAAFSVRVGRALRTQAYSIAFFVLLDEQRIWQLSLRELEFVAREIEDGGTWQRIRRLASGALRLEMPKGPSDFDLAYRMGPPPTRGA